jgi:hypothetical protein
MGAHAVMPRPMMNKVFFISELSKRPITPDRSKSDPVAVLKWDSGKMERYVYPVADLRLHGAFRQSAHLSGIRRKTRGLNPKKRYPSSGGALDPPDRGNFRLLDRPSRDSWSRLLGPCRALPPPRTGSRLCVSRGCGKRLRLRRGDPRTPSPRPRSRRR